MRTCRVCLRVKLPERFDGSRKQCKDCRNIRTRKYRNGKWLREKYLKYTYNLSIEQYNTMAEAQLCMCKICRHPLSMWKKLLAVDHCHTTGKIRGLLCDKCNKGLGQFDDNTQILNAAINYLRSSRA